MLHCVFRLANAPVEFASSWCEESLEQACSRLVLKVASDSDLDYDWFDLSKSSFLFLFFKHVVYHKGGQLEEYVLKSLVESVMKMAKLRNKTQKRVLNDLKTHEDSQSKNSAQGSIL